MFIFGILFLAVFGGLYAILCNFLFRLALQPLQVPKTFEKEWRRDRLITFILFVSIPLTYLGILLLLAVYTIGIVRHFRPHGAPPRLPLIPRIRLEELMVMVFSMALFPMIGGAITGSSGNDYMAFLFVLALLIFPLCFASAYYRLEAHRVPPGRIRMLFLFVYPYAYGSIHLLTAFLLILAIVSSRLIPIEYYLVYALAAVVPGGSCFVLARRAKAAGDRVREKEMAAATLAIQNVQTIPPTFDNMRP